MLCSGILLFDPFVLATLGFVLTIHLWISFCAYPFYDTPVVILVVVTVGLLGFNPVELALVMSRLITSAWMVIQWVKMMRSLRKVEAGGNAICLV